MKKRKPGTPFGKLLKGGLGSLFSESTTPKEKSKPKHHAFDHQSDCDSSADLLVTKKKKPRQRRQKKHVPPNNNFQSKFEARRADLSNGWVAMSYKFSDKEEMHFKSPHYNIRFRSLRGALLFDGILQNSTDESSAIQTFMNEHHNFRTMISNFGRYEKKRRMNKLKSNSNFQSCDSSLIKSSESDCKPQAEPRKRKLCSTSTDSQLQEQQKIDSSLVDKSCASRVSKRICERRQVEPVSDRRDVPNPS
eukprot:scaffold215812_cov20-Cyclotella_meneghiniana.AAC.1